MNSEEQIFSSRVAAAPRWMFIFKRLVIFVVALHLLIGLTSSYRAYFQVHNLNISTSEVLQDGTVIQTKVVTYGRTPVDVRLELIQNGRAVTLHEQQVTANEFGFYDPRTQTASFSVKMTPQLMDQLETGSAVLRATAVGRHQWMRLPPPFVREVQVQVSRFEFRVSSSLRSSRSVTLLTKRNSRLGTETRNSEHETRNYWLD